MGTLPALALSCVKSKRPERALTVGPVLDQELHHRRVLLAGRRTSGRSARAALGMIHLRAVIEQRLDCGGIARARRDHQRRLAFGCAELGSAPV